MRKRWLMCVLLGAVTWGQAAPSSPPPQSSPGVSAPADPRVPNQEQPHSQAPATMDSSAAIPADAAVITVIGVCQAQPKPAAVGGAAAKAAAKVAPGDCKTVITKAEFEKLAKNLAPNVTPQMKKQLEGLLPQWIALSNAAKKKGLDKTPQFEDRVRVLRMQILSNELRQNIQDEAGKVSPEEIEKYYKEHGDTYEQFNVDRLFVPRTKQVEAETKDEDDKKEKLTEEAEKAKQAELKTKAAQAEQSMTQLAESLHTRAVAGEDFVKLQKEAFAAAGMKIDAPTVNLPSVRRTGLPPAHTAVLDLKPGEVSAVINDSGGYYIYKVNSKTELPLDQATNEIRSKIQNDRMREMMEKLNSSFKVETNEAYFGPGPAGPQPPPRGPRPQSAPPAAPMPQSQTPPPSPPTAAKPN